MGEKVAIVTGAGRGIGRAVALTLAREGYNLSLASRSEEEIARVRQMAERQKVRAIAAPTDVTVPAEVAALVDGTTEAFGRVDLLVNVAGAAVYKEDITTLTDADFTSMVNVNFKGVFLTSRAVWPIMRQQKEGGVIVNISSLAARDPFPGYAVYGASKAAVNSLTESLAKAGRKVNIRVFSVCPGYVETALMRTTFPDVPADACLAPADVAEVVAWCATDIARPCTGQIVWMKKK
ncbi:MAG: SDR family NAD(P)-dependent oxidoreductase [Phycisphaerae bacterium]|nr:SDR family NAD(P)-dependent oxidoreductase [Phycisphaerae bacterium]